MFKIFLSTDKKASHARLNTPGYVPQLAIDQSPPPHDIWSSNGHQLASPVTPASKALLGPDSVQSAQTLKEPRKTHQRSFTEYSRPGVDLPPLITHHTREEQLLVAPASELRISDTQKTLPDQPDRISPTGRKAKARSLFIGDKTEANKAEKRSGTLAKWFDGESEPIKIGLIPSSKRRKPEPFDYPTSSSELRSSSSFDRKSNFEMTSKPAMASRFSFFSSRTSLSKSPPPSPAEDDELVNLNVRTALTAPETHEPLSFAALNNLQQQAEQLLNRLQFAYKERTAALKEAMAEKEALAEETQGAQARSKHLQKQLDTMIAKFEEQDEAMMNLVDELAQEKLARREAEAAHKRSIRLVEHDTLLSSANGRESIISDSGFESEEDSSAESLFSTHHASHSPTMSMSSISTTSSPDGPHCAEVQRITTMPPAARLRTPPSHVHKGIPVTAPPQRQSCANCEGVRATEALSMVSILKKENQGLKQRVGELEGALDGCLDVVGKIGG
ncbi:MAG: hypothetical protein Q9163_001912 [Psora crenata]